MYKEWKEHWLTGRVNPGKTWEWAITKSPAETGQVVSPQRSWVSLCMCHPKYDTSIASFPPDNALPESLNVWIREKKGIFLFTKTPSISILNHTTMLVWYIVHIQNKITPIAFKFPNSLTFYVKSKHIQTNNNKNFILLGEVAYLDHTWWK